MEIAYSTRIGRKKIFTDERKDQKRTLSQAKENTYDRAECKKQDLREEHFNLTLCEFQVQYH